MIPLQHRANAAMAAIDEARTPAQKHAATAEGRAVHADLKKHVAEGKAMAAFKAAKPQSMAGVYKGAPRFFFMVPAGGKIQTAAVTLPDGSKVIPIQNQIPVPENMVDAMIARGWVRMNSVITELGQEFRMSDPPIPNGTAA